MSYYKCGTPDNSKVDWESYGASGGYNLLMPSWRLNNLPSTSNGITFTLNDDYSITATGTASANVSLPLYARTSDTNFLKAGDYIFSCCPAGGSADSYLAFFGLYGSNWDVIYDDYGAEYAFTVTEAMESDGIALNLQIKSGTNIQNGITFKPMIRPASVKSSDFAPYALTNDYLTDRIRCNKTTAGTYVLKATVDANRNVSYSWVSE